MFEVGAVGDAWLLGVAAVLVAQTWQISSSLFNFVIGLAAQTRVQRTC